MTGKLATPKLATPKRAVRRPVEAPPPRPVALEIGNLRRVFLSRNGTALVIALLGFVATAALAKFIMRGEVIE